MTSPADAGYPAGPARGWSQAPDRPPTTQTTEPRARPAPKPRHLQSRAASGKFPAKAVLGRGGRGRAHYEILGRKLLAKSKGRRTPRPTSRGQEAGQAGRWGPRRDLLGNSTLDAPPPPPPFPEGMHALPAQPGSGAQLTTVGWQPAIPEEAARKRGGPPHSHFHFPPRCRLAECKAGAVFTNPCMQSSLPGARELP